MNSLPPDAFLVDLSAWADAQARVLREGRTDRLDHTNLSAMVGGLGLRERHELRARLGVVLTTLLRWAEQVDLRCHAWAVTLDSQRLRIARSLRENPSLRREVPELIARIYPVAKARAVLESTLFEESFPEACPFFEDDILQVGFYPDPHGDDAIRGDRWWMRGPLP